MEESDISSSESSDLDLDLVSDADGVESELERRSELQDTDEDRSDDEAFETGMLRHMLCTCRLGMLTILYRQRERLRPALVQQFCR